MVHVCVAPSLCLRQVDVADANERIYRRVRTAPECFVYLNLHVLSIELKVVNFFTECMFFVFSSGGGSPAPPRQLLLFVCFLLIFGV